MLLYLTDYLSQYYGGFRVFNYLTFRAILSCITAFGIALLIGPYIIDKLHKLKFGETIYQDGPKSHRVKAGTPTMGGALILISILLGTLLWSRLSNPYIWMVIFIIVSFGMIGWFDDYIKLSSEDSKGLSAKVKYLSQSIVAFLVVGYLFYTAQSPNQSMLVIPFMKQVSIQLGWVFPILAYFVIVGTSNAVNLTDGLDGLAILPTVMITGALGIFAYVAGNVSFANYLTIPYMSGVGELVVICAAIVGSGLGFLWFNTYPAQVFMGDTGALSLGAALGMIAVLVKQELVLFIMGGVFVFETLSVIIQVLFYKLTRKRVFMMAPLHHHFELKGWAEPKIIVRFWIITVILVLIGLSTLKLR